MTDLNALPTSNTTAQPIMPQPQQGNSVLARIVCANLRPLECEPPRYTAEHLHKLNTTHADAPIGASL